MSHLYNFHVLYGLERHMEQDVAMRKLLCVMYHKLLLVLPQETFNPYDLFDNQTRSSC